MKLLHRLRAPDALEHLLRFCQSGTPPLPADWQDRVQWDPASGSLVIGGHHLRLAHHDRWHLFPFPAQVTAHFQRQQGPDGRFVPGPTLTFLSNRHLHDHLGAIVAHAAPPQRPGGPR